jgi:hypothetical protein
MKDPTGQCALRIERVAGQENLAPVQAIIEFTILHYVEGLANPWSQRPILGDGKLH